MRETRSSTRGNTQQPALLRVDTSGSTRIPHLMEMVGALSKATGPQEVLRVFSSREELYGPRGYVSLSIRGLQPGQYRVTEVIELRGSYDLVLADPLLRTDPPPANTGGVFGSIISTTYPELFHNLNINHDPVMGEALAGYGSMMSVPLFEDGAPVNWTVFLREDPKGFTVADLEQAILRVNLVGAAVRNALIAQDLHNAHVRIRAEVEHIASIQQSLLPQPIPNIPGLSIAASYQTFDQAGGDYYDFRPLAITDDPQEMVNGPWAMLIGDASGHGPAAAVVMAMLHAILHAYPKHSHHPGAMLAYANEHLASKRIENSFVTAFLGVYDPGSRRLTYARAGHEPPLIREPGGQQRIRRLDAVGGIPLGMLDTVEYEETTIELEPGHTLLLYTDGITDARDPGGNMFGVERIEQALAGSTGGAASIVQSVMDPLRRHAAGVRPGDDQTLVAVCSEAR